MRYVIVISLAVVLTVITAHNYYHRLRNIRLGNSFCTAYQELKDGKCSARLSQCSALTPIELRDMRQILCGFRFDPGVQPDPPAPTNNLFPYPKHFADVFEADIHYYRFAASIYTSDRKYVCSGALVSPKTVITSASCVAQAGGGPEGGPGGDIRKRRQNDETEQTDAGPVPSGRLIVRLGEQHLNINPVFKNVYEYDVESIETVPQYDEASHQNDIAIIRLVSPVPICKFPPIYIPRKFEYWLDFEHIAGSSATYLGWGLNNQRPYFRALSGEVLSHHFCQKLFNWDYNQLQRSHLCLDAPSGVCVSDSGGPLITYTKDRWVLIGILTFGKHCRTPGLPLIFSRITESLNEITKYVEQDFHSRNATLLHEECHHNPFHSPIHPIKGHKVIVKPELHGHVEHAIDPHYHHLPAHHDVKHPDHSLHTKLEEHSLHTKLDDHSLHARGAVLPIEHIGGDYDYVNKY